MANILGNGSQSHVKEDKKSVMEKMDTKKGPVIVQNTRVRDVYIYFIYIYIKILS